MDKGHDKGHKGQMSDRDEPWDTTDMAHRAGGLSMEQEPVAFVCRGKLSTIGHCEECEPLYTAPPKREWVWLTDEEIVVCGGMDGADNWVFEFANALQIKLREKNHG